jgi:histidine triad (HIT) family protein
MNRTRNSDRKKNNSTNQPLKNAQTAPFGTHLPYTEDFEDDKNPMLNIEHDGQGIAQSAVSQHHAQKQSSTLPQFCPETIDWKEIPSPHELPQLDDCIFCRVGSGKSPCWLLYEDKWCVVFLDHQPLSEGHLLIIPRNHWRTLSEVPAHVMGHIGSIIPRIGQALSATMGKTDYNVLQNNGTAAGQVVPHVHCHLVPREAGDEHRYKSADGIKRGVLTAESAEDIIKRFKVHMTRILSADSKHVLGVPKPKANSQFKSNL